MGWLRAEVLPVRVPVLGGPGLPRDRQVQGLACRVVLDGGGGAHGTRRARATQLGQLGAGSAERPPRCKALGGVHAALVTEGGNIAGYQATTSASSAASTRSRRTLLLRRPT
jgi:hypothetical protein